MCISKIFLLCGNWFEVGENSGKERAKYRWYYFRFLFLAISLFPFKWNFCAVCLLQMPMLWMLIRMPMPFLLRCWCDVKILCCVRVITFLIRFWESIAYSKRILQVFRSMLYNKILCGCNTVEYSEDCRAWWKPSWGYKQSIRW